MEVWEGKEESAVVLILLQVAGAALAAAVGEPVVMEVLADTAAVAVAVVYRA
jgi:hypothetical protein